MSIIFAIRCSNLSISDSLKAWLPVSLLPIISKRASKNLVWNRRDNTHLLYVAFLLVNDLIRPIVFAHHMIVCFPVPLIDCPIPIWFFLTHMSFSRSYSTAPDSCVNQGNFASAQYNNCRTSRSSSCLSRNTNKFSTTF